MSPLRFFASITFLLFILLFGLRANSQDTRSFTDSLKFRLAGAHTPHDKVDLLLNLSLATSLDPAQSRAYGEEAISEAELSRDRWLIASAYLQNGKRYLNNSGLSDNLEQALKYTERAEQVARENGLESLLVDSYCQLAGIWADKGNNAKALTYSNEAMAAASNSDNDTAKVRAYSALGDTYLNMNEMLLSLQNFLAAMNIAEADGKDGLLRDVYKYLQRFYSSIHEYSKAVDYGMKAFQLDSRLGEGINMLMDELRIGDMYVQSKQLEIAIGFYERDFRLADSLHMPFMKFNTYFRIFNMYTLNGEYAKGMNYIGGHPEILNFLDSIGAQFFVHEIYGMAMTERREYDSALYYFRKGESEIEQNGNPEMQCNFYTFFGNYYQATKAFPAAIVYYKKALEKASAIQGLEYEEAIGDTLKGLYEKTGDYREALFYETFSSGVRDSIRNQTRVTDLMKLEVDNDNRRRDRLAREEEQRVEHRHNLQYMGLTVGLVVLFIGLVMLGRLAVPLSLIRALGFMSFIFLFEFIILLADKPIQVWTAEEPWKVLMIKIVLGAGLVPLHHWLEHKVIHYLGSRRKSGRAAYAKASAAKAETVAE
jgi:tetratricopeptide (TPR) repeat protein